MSLNDGHHHEREEIIQQESKKNWNHLKFRCDSSFAETKKSNSSDSTKETWKMKLMMMKYLHDDDHHLLWINSLASLSVYPSLGLLLRVIVMISLGSRKNNNWLKLCNSRNSREVSQSFSLYLFSKEDCLKVCLYFREFLQLQNKLSEKKIYSRKWSPSLPETQDTHSEKNIHTNRHSNCNEMQRETGLLHSWMQ